MNTLLAHGALFFQNSKKTVIFSSLVVFTLVLEEVLESVVFCCPCDNHLVYGLLFLLGPSSILFAAGILLNPNTWWLCSVRRFRSKYQGLECPKEYCKLQYRRILIIIGDILSKALISPSIWLILSFLQKSFFVCAAFGPGVNRAYLGKNTVGNDNTPCNGSLESRSFRDEEELMAKSQTIGLALSVTGTFFFLLCAFVSRCCGYKSNISLPDEKYYMRLEAMEAAKEFNKRAKQEAQKQGKEAVDKVFQEMESENQTNYLALLTIASKKLDQKYSSYYNSSLNFVERNPVNPEVQNKNSRKPLIQHINFEENLKRGAYFVVDGPRIFSTAERRTGTHTTIQMNEEEADIMPEQSGITRVCLRRCKSMNANGRL